MAIAMMVDNPEGSQEDYDGGSRVIEVWESEEDAKRFVKERLMRAFEAVGAAPPPPPQFWLVHNFIA